MKEAYIRCKVVSSYTGVQNFIFRDSLFLRIWDEPRYRSSVVLQLSEIGDVQDMLWNFHSMINLISGIMLLLTDHLQTNKSVVYIKKKHLCSLVHLTAVKYNKVMNMLIGSEKVTM